MEFRNNTGRRVLLGHHCKIILLLSLATVALSILGIGDAVKFLSMVEAGHGIDNPTQPNIIVIVTDDQGTDATSIPYFDNQLGCYTPKLAELAAKGRVFTNCRVNPKCSPTRAGLLSGRSAWNTGVVGVVGELKLADASTKMIRDRVSLQGDEITLAERLKSLGYNTILVDKWHTGWSKQQPIPDNAQSYHALQSPTDQGFDYYIDYHDFLCGGNLQQCGKNPPLCDCPDDLQDDHISWSVDRAVETVLNVKQDKKPYALFFWTIDPHIRNSPHTWWDVSPELLADPSVYNFNDETDRYRAVIEATDHELARMLIEIGVISSSSGKYLSKSNTVVFFLSDNGTPNEVSFFGPDRSKGSLFDGGIRVPLFAFGEKVPSDGSEMTQVVSHQDFFATIAQIAGDPDPNSDGIFRDSWSFADLIGWSDTALPHRLYTVSNRAESTVPVQTVSITDGQYKLIVPAGGPDFAKLGSPANGGDDILYKIAEGEVQNFAAIGNASYEELRKAVVDYWPSAVAEPFADQLDIPAVQVMSLNSDNERISDFGPRPVGFEKGGAINQPRETRILMRFDVSDLEQKLAQYGRTLDDITDAQVIFRFSHDSVLGKNKSNFDTTYSRFDADTAPLQLFPMVMNWDAHSNWVQIESGFDGQTPLGLIDPAPHILHADPTDRLSSVPLENGTPISFGREINWRDVIKAWSLTPFKNRGIVAKSSFITNEVPGDQRIAFRYDNTTDILLRITVK